MALLTKSANHQELIFYNHLTIKQVRGMCPNVWLFFARQSRLKFCKEFPVTPLHSFKPSISLLSLDLETSSSELLFPDSEAPPDSLLSQVMALQKRLDTMELFFKDCVVEFQTVCCVYYHNSAVI